jgi:hypothetical protein
MQDINKYHSGRLDDYIIFCDQCGAPCWRSEATLLKTETGSGGLLVCPRDVDPIDYGLVPYKIRPEKPVPVTRINAFNDNSNITNTYYPSTDYESFDPLSGYLITTWENINITFDNWDQPWGSV